MNKKTRLHWLYLLLFALMALPSCSDDKNEDPATDPDPEPEPPTVTETETTRLNKAVHTYLTNYYLWDEEYIQKNADPDYSQDFDNFFYNNLLKLSTNTLDGKTYSYEDAQGTHTVRSLYSYIEQLPDYAFSDTKAAGESKIAKENALTFGFLWGRAFVKGETQQGNIYAVHLELSGVYPDSPAAKAGIGRGHIIAKVDDKEILYKGTPVLVNGKQEIEYEPYANTELVNDLLFPEQSGSHTVTFYRLKEEDKTETVTLSTATMPLNPILHHQVDQVQGHTVGYLVYSNFDAGFDAELFDVFKEFKAAGITDLVLDLRYNGGGHTISANLISTCIAGDACKEKAFMELGYNSARMKKLNGVRPHENFAYQNYSNLSMALTEGMLNLSRLYVIVSANTASASELVINSLRGIDIPVFLIGTTTHGKNVGMEYIDLGKQGNYKSSEYSDMEHTYRVAPITFMSFNAKGESDYANGFAPDLEVDESNPFQEEKMLRIYRPWGVWEDKDRQEYLYCFALEEITGDHTILKRPEAQATKGVDQAAEEVLIQQGRCKQWPLRHRYQGVMLKPMDE